MPTMGRLVSRLVRYSALVLAWVAAGIGMVWFLGARGPGQSAQPTGSDSA